VTQVRAGRGLLALAAVAVAFAAADTYVVVLALPDIMHGVGLSVEQLQKGAPIVSGFLLGYVAMLPLIGRIADLRGRPPVLVAGLVVFAFGSLVTALAYDLPMMVTGRFLQGVGGGALVPATLALVADLYPVERRGVPLGIVSAVQELGSVVGPLLGAAILAVADWRAIFAVNLVVGVVLAVAIRRAAGSSRYAAEPAPPVRNSARGATTRLHTSMNQHDWPGATLLAIMLAAGTVLWVRPGPLVSDLTWGRLWIPQAGETEWTTPLGLVTMAAGLLLVVRCLTARRPLVDLRDWYASARDADLPGAVLLAIALGGVVLAFATADPKVQVMSAQGGWYLLGAALASAALVVHLRRAQAPLIPRGALSATPAWGSVVVSFFVGAALVAALIDVPLFARSTIYPDSQLLAALVLVRFLVALPVGALAGGLLVRRLPAAPVAAAGMLLAATGFWWMSSWGPDSLSSWTATLPLVIGGLGFGLALPPVNAAVLASTDHAVHGLAGALVVVARMVGMLVGVAGLTTLGLRRYYAEQADLPPVREVCDGASRCPAFSDLIRAAGVAQEHTVFAGAAVAALVAAGLALVLLRGAATRGVGTASALRALG
jgi:MFS family permease